MSGVIIRGSKFMTLSIKDLFLIKVLIPFHSELVSPKSLITTFITILTVSGGFASEANSFKLCELIPFTDFFASSIRG